MGTAIARDTRRLDLDDDGRVVALTTVALASSEPLTSEVVEQLTKEHTPAVASGFKRVKTQRHVSSDRQYVILWFEDMGSEETREHGH